MPHRPVRPAALVAFVLPLVLGACASGGGGGATFPVEGLPLPSGSGGVPGFDTRHYPGDPAMSTWRARSPYRWVGYYLPAPCYTGTTWLGKRATLERMGWGTAVIFLGEQDWAAGAAPPPDDVEPRCTSGNVTAERGTADGRAAAEATAAEGFPAGTWVYLDVERVATVSDRLRAYVEAWTRSLEADGRYRPALYVHAGNARDLHGVMAAAASATPRLWVAGGPGFDLEAHPRDSGFDAAHAWQGAFDVDDTFGDVTLRIDRNVADSRDPSR